MGKNVLGERRIPQDVALRELFDLAGELCPGLPRVWVDGDLPEVRESCIVFIPYVRRYPESDSWLDSLSDGVMVIGSQEICHQVTAHFRLR